MKMPYIVNRIWFLAVSFLCIIDYMTLSIYINKRTPASCFSAGIYVLQAAKKLF